MAISTPRRRPKDPEGRMPLREHLRELRSRVVRSAIAIALGAVAGWFLYDPLVSALKAPLEAVGSEHGTLAKLNYSQVASPFNLKLKLSVYIGLVVSCPVWLYQVWAFVVPGLTKREKRYALSFTAAAVPLFLSGMGLAWLVLPNAVRFFAEFTPEGSANLISADEYLTFVTQIFLAFGVAFVVPVLLVALNFVGVLSAAALGRQWRIGVFLNFLFAAIASPAPDAGSMLALAIPMSGLFGLSVLICWLNDRRRARRDRDAGFGDLDDDEASPLEPRPAPLDEPSSPDSR